MAKTAIFLANGFEEIEGLTVVDILRRAKIDITMVSITGAKAVEGSHGIKLEADERIEDFNFEGVDMIILPGGMPGTKNLDACAPLKAKIEVLGGEPVDHQDHQQGHRRGDQRINQSAAEEQGEAPPAQDARKTGGPELLAGQRADLIHAGAQGLLTLASGRTDR